MKQRRGCKFSTHTQTHTRKEREGWGETNRQTDGQTNRHRQTDGQTGRRADRQTGIQTESARMSWRIMDANGSFFVLIAHELGVLDGERVQPNEHHARDRAHLRVRRSRVKRVAIIAFLIPF